MLWNCCVGLQRKEDVMMSRIKDAEYAQVVAEMRQRIAELEIEVSKSTKLVAEVGGVHTTVISRTSSASLQTKTQLPNLKIHA